MVSQIMHLWSEAKSNMEREFKVMEKNKVESVTMCRARHMLNKVKRVGDISKLSCNRV